MEIRTKSYDELREKYDNKCLELEKLKIKLESTAEKLKTEHQKKLNDLEKSYDQAINDLILKHEKDLSNFERKLREEHYEKFQEELTKLHTQGNVQTKFIKDMALEMVKKAPTHKVEYNGSNKSDDNK